MVPCGGYLDNLCAVANRWDIFFLWRPVLPDPKDEMLLEPAVVAGCDTIVTFNQRDFLGVDQFGIRVVSPGAFLREIGVIT